jgi:hypothetical protein
MQIKTNIRRFAALLVVAVAVVGILATTAQAAQHSPQPNATWYVTTGVVNNTPYTMNLVGVNVNTCTGWTGRPDQTIAPGKSTATTFLNDCYARGVDTTMTYDLLNAQGKAVGRVKAVADLDTAFNWWGWDASNRAEVVFGPGVTSSATRQDPSKQSSEAHMYATATFQGGDAAQFSSQ